MMYNILVFGCVEMCGIGFLVAIYMISDCVPNELLCF